MFAILLAGGLAWLLLSRVHPIEKHLADGSIVRVEKVAFGKQEHIAIGGRFARWRQWLPPFLQKLISKKLAPAPGSGNWNYVSTMHTNEKALYVYISRRDGKTGKYQNVGLDSAVLVDEHGCVIDETQSGGYNDTLGSATSRAPGTLTSDLVWLRFEAFPRREKSFRVRLFQRNGTSSSPKELCEFVIANPAPAPAKSDWVAEPLPVTRTVGGASFTLASVIPHPTANPLWMTKLFPQAVDAEFVVTENGQPSSSWLPLTKELWDSDGNFASEMDPGRRFLCPHVAMWKYRVQFFGDEDSRAASNAVWVLRGVAVPGDGKFMRLNATNLLQGVPILIGALGGPGKFTYSNNVPLSADPSDKNPDETSGGGNYGQRNSANAFNWPPNWRGGRFAFGGPQPAYKVDAQDVHLAFEMGELGPDQRLTVRAVDENGWVFHAAKLTSWRNNPNARLKKTQAEDYLDNGHSYEPPFLAFELPRDSKKVDIYICVHTGYTAEFMFKPPQETNAAAR